MFERLLIANRGEIACRVIRTARAMGLHTIAVHSDLDRDAPHVRAAEESVAVTSYLDIEGVVAAALECGADAIHPGYGFLSERAAFAQAVEKAGLVLVGPSAEVMDLMGRKDAARRIAAEAGVPVVPSYDVAADPAGFDFPVLVKAAAGGGGKGMRVVRRDDEYAEALAAARREAASAFGDDTMLVEKYVESGRHVEVQVIADAHGHVLHLFERDCSTQRRHQKVLEEAPAPTITPEQRELVTSSAVALATRVGYVNAGTVEFLVDDSSGEAYFLEMNTRLQVEHPVTELAVSVGRHPLDLVELQLRVAAGEPLPFGQDDVRLDGHAIEARVYAEDSFGGFLPQAGTATFVRWPFETGLAGPPQGPVRGRVDHALESGQLVSTSYDPMLGKVISHGPDRESAPTCPDSGTRRHRDPRTDHEHRLPPRDRGEPGVPRVHHRHGVAGPARGGAPRPRARPARRCLGALLFPARGGRAVPLRRFPRRRGAGTDHDRARRAGAAHRRPSAAQERGRGRATPGRDHPLGSAPRLRTS